VGWSHQSKSEFTFTHDNGKESERKEPFGHFRLRWKDVESLNGRSDWEVRSVEREN